MWRTRQPHEGKLGSTHLAGPGLLHKLPSGSEQERRGTTEPEAQGPTVPPGQRAPATSDHLPRAGGQCKNQNRCADSPALRRSLGPTSSPPVYTPSCTHTSTHTYTCLCRNSWWVRGQGIGEGTPRMTGACLPCSSHLPKKEVPPCTSPTPSYMPKIPHTPLWLPHTPTTQCSLSPNFLTPVLGLSVTWPGLTSSRTADHLPLLFTPVRISSGPVTVLRAGGSELPSPSLGPGQRAPA